MSLLAPDVVIFQVGVFAVNDVRWLKLYKNLANLTSAIYILFIAHCYGVAKVYKVLYM